MPEPGAPATGRMSRWRAVETTCFRLGHAIVSMATLGRVRLSGASRGYAVGTFAGIFTVLVVMGAIALLVDPDPSPQPGLNLFGSSAQFERHVARLGLDAMTTGAAIGRLQADGFRCETFADGNVACDRDVKGSNCGERQTIDLLSPGAGGLAGMVRARFGRTCFRPAPAASQSY